jgi:hypothetical protein
MDIKARAREILQKARIDKLLYRFVVKVLASTTMTFGYTFGILFSLIFLFQFFQGFPDRLVEIEPLSLLLIPIVLATLMVVLRIALIRRYSRIRT